MNNCNSDWVGPGELTCGYISDAIKKKLTSYSYYVCIVTIVESIELISYESLLHYYHTKVNHQL